MLSNPDSFVEMTVEAYSLSEIILQRKITYQQISQIRAEIKNLTPFDKLRTGAATKPQRKASF